MLLFSTLFQVVSCHYCCHLPILASDNNNNDDDDDDDSDGEDEHKFLMFIVFRSTCPTSSR